MAGNMAADVALHMALLDLTNDVMLNAAVNVAVDQQVFMDQ
jgi:hypothetical protein